MDNFISHIETLYESMDKKNKEARMHFNRPLTYVEKILSLHMKNVCDEKNNALNRNESYAKLLPDRVAMQDATAQMALLQFINSGKKKVSLPSTVHCDHLIKARHGAVNDLILAKIENKEVYDFLASASKKYGLGFWGAGSGIIHQVILENYAFPGGMIIGTDSHTPNAGGLGMIAIGVGGSDVVDVMIGDYLNIKWPGIIGVNLIGKLNGWATAKDIILKLMDILTVKGGTGHIIEFFGDGCENISATGKATITNMGAEHGATTSIFPYDQSMKEYLDATERADWGKLADQYMNHLKADSDVYNSPSKFFNKIIDINLNTLTPYIAGPHTPDKSCKVSMMRKNVDENNFLNSPSAALIGSCTNSSYYDIGRVSYLADFAYKNNIKLKMPFFVTPGSETTYSTILRDKYVKNLIKIGAVILSNACGPCIGQWDRDIVSNDQENSIISSYNRNFPGRNDGNRKTLSFIASPEMVMAIALSGDLSFNPYIDEIESEDGRKIKLPLPKSNNLPEKNFQMNRNGFISFNNDFSDINIEINPKSKRLCLLEKFSKFDKKNFLNMPILLKAKGKCTTDHISQAGSWLKFRGHLERISENTYLGAMNEFFSEIGAGMDPTSSKINMQQLPDIAKSFKMRNISWAVIGDDNFGEGSSREHAAMQPRYLGCKVIIAKSFARIHETNLKKHGVLPLTFNDISDYNKIQYKDRIEVLGLDNISEGNFIYINVYNEDKSLKITCNHSLSYKQILWFKAGSTLNYISNKD